MITPSSSPSHFLTGVSQCNTPGEKSLELIHEVIGVDTRFVGVDTRSVGAGTCFFGADTFSRPEKRKKACDRRLFFTYDIPVTIY